jgi:hypothetical protein
MGDGRFYAPTQPKPPINEKRIKELEAIFEEALRQVRDKN